MSYFRSALIILVLAVAPVSRAQDALLADGFEAPSGEEFVGPFSSWANVRTDFGAIGDGVANDTPALQTALNSLSQSGSRKVLYLPAGTYRIRATLTMRSLLGVALIGEDPTRTIIRWAGPAQGTMLDTMGVAYSRFSRITWDGAGTAQKGAFHRWDGSSNYFPVQLEHSDSVFKDMGACITAGQVNQPVQVTATDSTIMRTHFLRCSDVGFRTNDFNSLLWIVADSRFEDNRRGIESWPGSTFAYRNVFKRSTDTDIFAALGPTFSARGNFSEGSRTFFVGSDRCTFSLQGNTVVGATNEAVRGEGALMMSLFDNVFASSVGVRGGNGYVLSVGNVYRSAGAFVPGGYFSNKRLDDRIEANPTITEPAGVPFWPRATAPVVEVSAFTGAAIQSAIDSALTNFPGRSAIVHLRAGEYAVAQSIVIPANADLRLVGDPVAGTLLRWTGPTGGQMLSVAGPTKVRIFDISLLIGGGNADGIVLTNADQVGGSVFAYLSGPNGFANQGSVGYLIDGLDETKVHLLHPDNMGARSGGMRVIGGPRSAAGQVTPSQVNVFGGFMVANNGPIYDVRNGGRLRVADHWFEPSSSSVPAAFSFTGSATVTYEGINLALPRVGTTRPDLAVFPGVTGRFTIHGTAVTGTNVVVSGNNPNQNVLHSMTTFGGWGLVDPEVRYRNTATAGTAATLMSETSFPFTEDGNPTDAWLRQMYAQLRADLPTTRATPTPGAATDFRLYRVQIEASDVGLRIQASQ